MKKKTVSDIISKNDILSWKPNDNIGIGSGTGQGKSYFIKNALYDMAKSQNKRILMLVHRKNCVDQFNWEIKLAGKNDVIDIRTYQSLETEFLKQGSVNLDKYGYIVCDEFHYFISDAGFNTTTDVSLELILQQSHAIKIFMSATGEEMETYLNKVKNIKTISYNLPINFKHIKRLTFFHHDDSIENLLQDFISRNEKAIFFLQSAEKAYRLYNKYKQYCTFNCSTNNNTYYKHVDKDKIDTMLKQERFESLILITTSCMDAGVNIIDNELHNIVADIIDVGSLIQCLGRKRIQSDTDTTNIYIKAINNETFGGLYITTKNKMEMAEYFKRINGNMNLFLQRYPRLSDSSNIIYDNMTCGKLEKRVNELMLHKCRLINAEISIYLRKDKEGNIINKFAYCQNIRNILKKQQYSIYEDDNKQINLSDYLELNKNKKLDKNQQIELIKIIGLKDGRGRLQKSVNLLSLYLIEKFSYNLIANRCSLDGKKTTYWILQELKK